MIEFFRTVGAGFAAICIVLTPILLLRWLHEVIDLIVVVRIVLVIGCIVGGMWAVGEIMRFLLTISR